MSTQLIDNKRFSLVEYCGGKHKVMYQITQRYNKPLTDEWCHRFGYVQLSKQDIITILVGIIDSEQAELFETKTKKEDG